MQYGRVQGKKERRFVYMAIHKHEQGFSLVSMLVMSTIFFMTLPLLIYITKSVTYESNYDELSIRQFYQFLRDELIQATSYTINQNQLVLVAPDGDKISFMQYNHEILRKVDGQGHDVYLRNVEAILFKKLSYDGIQVEITSLEGNKYEKSIMFYADVER